MTTPPWYAGSKLTAAALNSIVPQVVTLATNQPITSTSPTPLTGMSWPVVAGQYQIRGNLQGQQGGTNATQDVGFSGPATSFCRIFFYASTVAGVSSESNISTLTTIGIDPGGAGNTFYLNFEGTIVFSAAGTLEVIANEVVADSFTMIAGSTATLTGPVS
jgi:hypothetical protein